MVFMILVVICWKGIVPLAWSTVFMILVVICWEGIVPLACVHGVYDSGGHLLGRNRPLGLCPWCLWSWWSSAGKELSPWLVSMVFMILMDICWEGIVPLACVHGVYDPGGHLLGRNCPLGLCPWCLWSWWSSAGKELSPWLVSTVFMILVVICWEGIDPLACVHGVYDPGGHLLGRNCPLGLCPQCLWSWLSSAGKELSPWLVSTVFVILVVICWKGIVPLACVHGVYDPGGHLLGRSCPLGLCPWCLWFCWSSAGKELSPCLVSMVFMILVVICWEGTVPLACVHGVYDPSGHLLEGIVPLACVHGVYVPVPFGVLGRISSSTLHNNATGRKTV